MITGPLIGGAVVAAFGPHPAYIANAVSFVASAMFLARIPSRSLQSEPARSRGYLRDLLDGTAAVFHSRPLLTVFCAWNTLMFSLAAANTAEVELARHDFHAGNFGYGLFVAASGVGIFIGALSARSVLELRPFAAVYALGYILIAASFAMVSQLPALAIAVVFMIVGGIGNGVLLTANPMLVQQGAPDGLRGRTFTLIMSANALVLTVASLAAGWLTDQTSAHFVWSLAAAGTVVAGLVAWVFARPLSLKPEADIA